MLRSLSVGLLVAFAQMMTLGVGQMNIAVGALGGLTAIMFGATHGDSTAFRFSWRFRSRSRSAHWAA